MSISWIRVSYSAFLGMVLAVTAGFGVALFASGPRPPQPVGFTFSALSASTPTAQDSASRAKQIDRFYSDAQTYRGQYPDYQRSVFLWDAGLGIVLAVIGIALPALVNHLRLGLLVGGGLLLAVAAWFAVQPVPQAAPPAGSLLALLSAGTPSVLDTAGRFLRFAVGLIGFLLLLLVGLWRLTAWPAVGVGQAASPLDSGAPGRPATAPESVEGLLAEGMPAPAVMPAPTAHAFDGAESADSAGPSVSAPRDSPPAGDAEAGASAAPA